MKASAKLIGLILTTVLLLASCSSTAWTTNPYKGYDKDRYICAVGRGATSDEADLAARKELASLFGMQVQSTVLRTYMESSVERDGANTEGSSEVFTSMASSTVNVDDLYGVEIAKRTSKDGEHISLAVMERKTTSEYYRSKLDSSLQRLQSLEDDVLENIGTLKALERSVEYVRLCNECNVSTVMYNYLSGDSLQLVDMSKGYGLQDKALDAIVLEVDVMGDDSGAVKSSIGRILTDAGLSVSNGSRTPTAKVVVEITWSEQKGTGVASSFTFALYNADVSFVDLAGSEAVMVESFKGREGHQSFEGARSRAVSAIAKELDSKLSSVLKDTYSYRYPTEV